MSIRRRLALAICASALAFAGRVLSAQNVITIRPGAGGQITATPNTTVAVPIVIDMSAAGGTNLASLTTTVSWSPTRLTFDSLKAGSFGSVSFNSANASAGQLSLSVFDAAGTTSTVTVATVYFTASTGATSVTLLPTAAGSDVGANLMSIVRVRKLDACVALSGLWGDVNIDNAVDIIDAQQLARSTVGLSVSNAAAVATQGDVTNDGVVNIVDAQQIARFSVSLSASARTNTTLAVTPVATTITIPRVYALIGDSYLPSPLLEPSPGGQLIDLAVGQRAQLDPVAKDANGVDISACLTFVYTTNDPTTATVSASGVVTALLPGLPGIFAAAGSGAGAPSVAKAFRVRGSMVLIAPLVNGTKNVALPVQPELVFKTASGDTATNINGLIVTAAKLGGPGAAPGSLQGTQSVQVANGVARFTDLSITAEGQYQLVFSAPGTPSVTSNAFAIGTSGPAVRVSVQPAGATSGAPFATQPVVEVVDGAGQVVTSDNSTVVTAAYDLGSGTLSGTLTATASSGIATFTNLAVTGVGTHRISFSAPSKVPATSTLIVAGPASALAMSRQPGGSVTGTVLSIQPVIQLVDNAGNGTTGSNAVTASIASGSGTLSGTTTVNAVGGVASFTNLAVTGSGTVALTFSASGLTPVTSAGFAVLTDAAPIVSSVAAGIHSCSHSSAGTYCWGGGQLGQLGDGTTVQTRPTPIKVSNGDSIVSLVVGMQHTCGLTSGGIAYCWGDNTLGSVGNGATTGLESVPQAVSGGLTFTSLSTGGGSRHTCGVTTTGAAYCWGNNSSGALGSAVGSYSRIPVLVPGGRTFAVLAVGGVHTCGVTTGNDIYCWGLNYYGQIGNGSTSGNLVASPPQLVVGGHQFVKVAAGLNLSCGLTVAGKAYCWGGNSGYGTGDGSTTAHNVPTAVAGTLVFSSVTAGWETMCGLTTSAAAYCWGSNEDGVVGDGTTVITRLTPVAVAGSLTFSMLSVGERAACGLTTGGTAYCWGKNEFGGVGDGTTIMRSAPTAVLYP
ncbi:MAG: hypothetical protein V4550_04050 [Gemmatimonadota bacterium]